MLLSYSSSLFPSLTYKSVASPGSHGDVACRQSEGHPRQVAVGAQFPRGPEQGPQPRPSPRVFARVFRASVPGFERSEPDQPTAHSTGEAHPLLPEHRYCFQCPHLGQVPQPVLLRWSPLPDPARPSRLQESRPTTAEVPHEQLHVRRRHAQPLCGLQGERELRTGRCLVYSGGKICYEELILISCNHLIITYSYMIII